MSGEADTTDSETWLGEPLAYKRAKSLGESLEEIQAKQQEPLGFTDKYTARSVSPKPKGENVQQRSRREEFFPG